MGFGFQVQGFRVQGSGCRASSRCMVYGSRFQVQGLWLRVYGLRFKVFQGNFTWRRKPKTLQHLARGVGFVEGARFLDSYQRGGFRSPPPHGTNPGIAKGGKARGRGGGRTGRRNPSGTFPGAMACWKERLCWHLHLSTRDRTSSLMEASSQSLGS